MHYINSIRQISAKNVFFINSSIHQTTTSTSIATFSLLSWSNCYCITSTQHRIFWLEFMIVQSN